MSEVNIFFVPKLARRRRWVATIVTMHTHGFIANIGNNWFTLIAVHQIFCLSNGSSLCQFIRCLLRTSSYMMSATVYSWFITRILSCSIYQDGLYMVYTLNQGWCPWWTSRLATSQRLWTVLDCWTTRCLSSPPMWVWSDRPLLCIISLLSP